MGSLLYRRAFFFALQLFIASACSYVEVPVPDKKQPNGTKFVIGRTNELENVLGLTSYTIAVHPRGQHGQYGFVSVDGHGPLDSLYTVADGLNEHGLSVGAQTLRESEYEQSERAHRQIKPTEVVGTLLGNCADIDDALSFLEESKVVGHGGTFGFHWALADRHGRSVVIEYLKGQRVVYENTPRVMTNDPPLDWHWRNLNTFVNLSPDFPHQNDVLQVETDVGTVPRTIGHGFNLYGLPGDISPPSRFANLFYLREYALRGGSNVKSTEDAMVLATGLLNRVFIPTGVVAPTSSPEYTPFAVLKVPAEGRLLVRGYRNLRWRQVDLTRVDFAKARSWPVEDGTLGVEDLLLGEDQVAV